MSLTPPFRVAELAQNSSTAFALRPDAEKMAALADTLGLSSLRKLSFAGDITAKGKRDWQLTGRLGATITQPCVVTLNPVTTRIDVDVARIFVADLTEPEAPEIEMPEDDTVEALGTFIDPDAIMAEALALHIPLYPRSEGAALDGATFTEPGKTPMSDEEARPFAGLADLRDRLKKDNES
ncbi:DUF177 domain-containing protein [Thalassococcus sp. S3]|uniref:YceD family protein n=1 Tax=Thalassococcus sp. S3 TaxID=2017482 RepID=UPI0010248E75|nr:DUF177 domain-containing protein [Thalassococcus sp. S3]QBF31585.1 hypothetical protein CFI11_10205 [Thalassococcus sp. S3]